MSARRPPLMRKRPAPGPRAAGAEEAMSATKHQVRLEQQVSNEGSTNQAPVDLSESAENLEAELSQALSQQHSLDSESVELIKNAFQKAIRDAADGKLAVTSDPLSEDAWNEAVESLVQQEVINETEASSLTRRLNDALEPLRTPQTAMAIEFSRRLQTDGQEKALAWFREESHKLSAGAGSAQQEKTPAASSSLPQQLSNEITTSKSRRLRGPPLRRR